jgi:hypothetical protein
MGIRNFNLKRSQVSKEEKILEAHLPPLHTPHYAMVIITKTVGFQQGNTGCKKDLIFESIRHFSFPQKNIASEHNFI